MLYKQSIGLLMLLGSCFLEVTSRPSDDTTLQYLPFYGGAKGQYLEVKTDRRGVVVSQNVVPEDKITQENLVKDSAESLLSRILSAQLLTLQSLSSNVIRLHNIGRNVGHLNSDDKTRFMSQLVTLSETASNIVKTIEEIDDVDSLFKPPQPASSGTKRHLGKEDTDDVGEEETVSIDNPEITDEILEGATIAEAKPFGLAVIGEHGLAASRPQAVAVALTGVAVARPVATAIAGINPADLNIDYHVQNDEQ